SVECMVEPFVLSTHSVSNIFVAATTSSSDRDLTYRARYADARLRQPGRVRRVPRPAVVRQDAWTLLPKHCGTAPDGRPYVVEQPRGDIVGLPGSSALIACATQKPVVKARVELLGAATESAKGTS